MTPINGPCKAGSLSSYTLPETNSEFTPEAMDGWNTIVCFLLKEALFFRGYVSFISGRVPLLFKELKFHSIYK